MNSQISVRIGQTHDDFVSAESATKGQKRGEAGGGDPPPSLSSLMFQGGGVVIPLIAIEKGESRGNCLWGIDPSAPSRATAVSGRKL